LVRVRVRGGVGARARVHTLIYLYTDILVDACEVMTMTRPPSAILPWL
jgi:hypothetical protein